VARILVVDDRPVNREFLAVLLGYAGHDVHEAGDGAEALEVARRIAPDLVISDILMPTMDGVELVKRLGADPDLAHVPVVFYTATYRLAEARELAASCGVATIIAKPSEPQVVLDAVHGELGLPTNVAVARAAAPRVREAAVTTERLCRPSIEALAAVQEGIRAAIERGDSPGSAVRRLDRLSGHLEQSITRAQALSMRLAAIVELSFDLGDQDDPRQLIELFCRAARDVLNAKFAAVAVLEESGKLKEHAISGVDAERASAIRAGLDPTAGIFGRVLREGEPQRLTALVERETVGLPAAHPTIDDILVIALKSANRTYGWCYIADRVGTTAFEEDDEQLMLMLGSLLAREYENLVFYERIERHASLLEAEVVERNKALDELGRSERRFRELAENIREVFFLVDARSGAILYVSPAYEAVWDRSCESLYARPQSWIDSVYPEDRIAVLRALAESRRAGSAALEYRIVRGDEIRWIKSRTFPIFDAAGQLHHVAGTAEDITDGKLQDIKIRRLSRIYSVLSRINSAIVRIHERRALLDEACRITIEHGGFEVAWIGLFRHDGNRAELVACEGSNRPLAERFARVLVDDAIARNGPAAETLRSHTHTVYNDLHAASETSAAFRLALDHRFGSAVALPLMSEGRATGAIVLFAAEKDFFDAQEMAVLDELAGDVSFALQYIEKAEQLHHLAYYDPLTGLPNTALFQERLSQLIDRRDEAATTAVFAIDLDRFTHLNDSLGRHVGDQLLVAVGERLQAALPESGNLARIGSDTFALTASKLRHASDAGLFLHERILGAFGRPFQANDRELRISARAGVAVHPADGEDAVTLFKNAEAALMRAKSSGARFLFYSPDLNARVAEDLVLEQKLIAAVENGEFVLHYQPKVDATTQAVTGLEALLRWNHPTDGMVRPDRFIPTLEDSELILEVGQWVLSTALADCRRWREDGLEPPPIAVNVSPIQLRYADFPDMVLATIERSGCSGDVLELEITESVIMADIAANTERLQRICAAGVTIAIDDFGTGYSSLRYLARLPVDALKIDRSFVVGMTSDPSDMTLVSTIIALAHSFDLAVVAEGVDSEEQAKLLRLLKCDSMQGYLFSEPLPAHDVEALLRSAR
jgi:diguanylate cyclase